MIKWFFTCRRICAVRGRVESLVRWNDPVEKSFCQKEAAQSGDEPTVSQFARNHVQHRSSFADKHRIGGQLLNCSQRESNYIPPGSATESTVHRFPNSHAAFYRVSTFTNIFPFDTRRRIFVYSGDWPDPFRERKEKRESSLFFSFSIRGRFIRDDDLRVGLETRHLTCTVDALPKLQSSTFHSLAFDRNKLGGRRKVFRVKTIRVCQNIFLLPEA
jgi:hypothetical protein